MICTIINDVTFVCQTNIIYFDGFVHALFMLRRHKSENASVYIKLSNIMTFCLYSINDFEYWKCRADWAHLSCCKVCCALVHKLSPLGFNG